MTWGTHGEGLAGYPVVVVIRRSPWGAEEPECGDTRNVIADIVGNGRCGIVRGRPAVVNRGEGTIPGRSEREIGKGARNGRHPFHAVCSEGIAG